MIATLPSGRRAGLASISFALFLLATLAIDHTRTQAWGPLPLWPANGIILGLLVSVATSRADARAILGGTFAANVAYLVATAHPSGLIALHPIANVIEIVAAGVILRELGGIRGAFARVRDVGTLIVACLAAPLFSATIGTIGTYLVSGIPVRAFWVDWYVAAALSLAIFVPVVLVLVRFDESLPAGTMSWLRIGELALILLLVACTVSVIFFATRQPLMFATMPPVLVATFRLRQFGAMSAIVIVAAVAVRATVAHHGPIAVHAEGSSELLVLQLYLAVTFLSSLPVAAALSERERSREEAHMLADHFRAVVDNAADVIFRTDLKGRWTYLNPAWRTLSGFTADESLGRNWLQIVDDQDRDDFSVWALPVLIGEVETSRRLVRVRTRDRDVRWIELSVQALRDTHGQIVGTTGTLRDVDDRKKLEERVLHAKRRAEEQAREATLLASTDELTGLANRRAFLRDLDRRIEEAGVTGGAVAVAIFDVDHFKAVNDRHGHAIGDRVLRLVGSRSAAIVRSNDVIGRLGGEEFGILMPGASIDDAAAAAERLRVAINGPDETEADGVILPPVTVSVGVAAHVVGQSASTLLATADRALYAAKAAGRNMVKLSA